MNKNFHDLEDTIIDIEYLVKALQLLSGDDGVRITLLKTLEEKVVTLKTAFYCGGDQAL